MKLLSDDKITKVIVDATMRTTSPRSAWKAMCKAQDELTRPETLKEVGEWLRKECDNPHHIGYYSRKQYCYECLDSLKQGKME